MQRPGLTVTNVVAAVTALAWMIAVVLGKSEAAAYGLGFIPLRLSGAPVPWPAVPAAITPLTATLVHSGLLHLGFNLLVLLWCGAQEERVLGKTGLVVLYIVGAYVAAAAQFLVDPSGTVPMVGASGAISAVIGAYSLSFGRPKRVTSSPRLNRWINALWLLAAWVVLQLMMGFIAGTQGYMLATPAHVGGFFAGLALERALLLWRYRNA